MPHVFLSYKREDLKAASRLLYALRAEGLEVWWDRDIPTGAPWEATIEKALAESAVVLVCWSKAAVASENVRSEARWAREQERLIQLFVQHCNPPLFFGERQGIDLTDWNGDASDPRFRQIVSSARAFVGNGIASTGAPAARQRGRVAGMLSGRSGVWLAGAVLVAGALLAWHAPHGGSRQTAASAPQSDRVAARRFDVLDHTDADLRQFSAGLQAEMVDQLNQNQISVAAPDPGSKEIGTLNATAARSAFACSWTTYPST
jgi:hypothetical protein